MATDPKLNTADARPLDQVLESDRRFRELVENLDSVFWIFDTRTGRVEYVSPAYQALWGRSCESLYASPRSFLEAIHPEDVAAVQRTLEQQRQNRSTVIEYRVIRPDGSVRWIQDRGFPIADGAGQVRRVMGAATDISPGKAIEERSHLLAEVSQVLAGTLAISTIYARLAELVVPALADLCIVDLMEDGKLRRATTRARAGHEEMAAWVRRSPPDLGESRHPLMRAMAQRQVIHERANEQIRATLGPTPDRRQLIATLKPRAYVVTPLLSRGRVLGGLTFIRTALSPTDFTPEEVGLIEELTRRTSVFVDNAVLFQEAERAVRLRDEFLAVASHELKTPLTTLRLQVDSLQRHAAAGRELTYDRISTSLDRIHTQVGRLQRLIEELLDVSRIQAGHLDLRPEAVDLGEMAAEVVGVFRRHPADGERIQLLAEAGIVGRWDRTRLDQILTNLMSNAVKYGRDRPVAVSIRSVDGFAIIDVTDQGIGIPRAEQARIFDRFERAAPAEHYGGIGLGLWVVKEVIETMGGSISLRSEVDVGSTFTVRLPLHTAAR